MSCWLLLGALVAKTMKELVSEVLQFFWWPALLSYLFLVLYFKLSFVYLWRELYVSDNNQLDSNYYHVWFSLLLKVFDKSLMSHWWYHSSLTFRVVIEPWQDIFHWLSGVFLLSVFFANVFSLIYYVRYLLMSIIYNLVWYFPNSYGYLW